MNAIQVIRQHIELPQLLGQRLTPIRLVPRLNSSPLPSRRLKPLIRRSYPQPGESWHRLLKGV